MMNEMTMIEMMAVAMKMIAACYEMDCKGSIMMTR